MKKFNKYLVGGDGLPMKFVRAATPTEAVEAWRKKTGDEKNSPTVTPVCQQEPEKPKATTKAKRGSGGAERQEGDA